MIDLHFSVPSSHLSNPLTRLPYIECSNDTTVNRILEVRFDSLSSNVADTCNEHTVHLSDFYLCYFVPIS